MNNRYTLAAIAALVLAGCGGAEGAPTSIVPQSLGNQGSSLAKHHQAGALMYVAGLGASYVLTYPQGNLAGTINQGASGACSDSAGSVYLVGNSVSEYSHGATMPSRTLSLSSTPYSCSVNPVTRDLAVTLPEADEVAVFPSGSGSPTIYDPQVSDAQWCGYDDAGNLFVDGYAPAQITLAELPANGNAFSALTVDNPYSVTYHRQVQWDGHHMTVEVTVESHPSKVLGILQLSVSGSQADVISESRFNTRHAAWSSWIENNRLIVPVADHGAVPNIGIWAYPKGGDAAKEVRKPAGATASFTGVTVSVAP